MNKKSRSAKTAFLMNMSLAAFLLVGSIAAAQSAQVQGVINGRSGATMTVQTQDAGNVVVLLTANTDVRESTGLFHARKKQMAVTALVPGLQVQVKGPTTARTS